MTLRNLYVKLQLQAESYNNAIRQAQRETREFERMIRPTMKAVEDLGRTMRTVGIGLTAALTAPIAAVAGLGVQFNAMQEQAQIAFTTMLGDGQKARAFLEDMKEFAAKTPFEFPDLVRASQRLLAMGFAAEQVKPLLRSVGDAAAGLGGSADTINRITLALGQMQGRGRIATQEMNQLTEVGIPAWRMLAEGMGVSEQKLRDMVEKGLVPAGRSVEILQRAMDQTFGGMMAKQAETFTGLLSTIKDEASFMAGDLTTGLFNLVKGPLKQAADMLHSMRNTIAGMSDESKALFTVLAAGLAAIGPGLIGASLAITAISSGIHSIAALRGVLLATVETVAGVGAIRSFGEARIAIDLYAKSVQGARLAWMALAAEIGLYIAAAAAIYKIGEAVYYLNQALAESQEAFRYEAQTVQEAVESLQRRGIAIDTNGKSTREIEEAIRIYNQALRSSKTLEGEAAVAATRGLRDRIEAAQAVVRIQEELSRSQKRLSEFRFSSEAMGEDVMAFDVLKAKVADLELQLKSAKAVAELLGRAITPATSITPPPVELSEAQLRALKSFQDSLRPADAFGKQLEQIRKDGRLTIAQLYAVHGEEAAKVALKQARNAAEAGANYPVTGLVAQLEVMHLQKQAMNDLSAGYLEMNSSFRATQDGIVNTAEKQLEKNLEALRKQPVVAIDDINEMSQAMLRGFGTAEQSVELIRRGVSGVAEDFKGWKPPIDEFPALAAMAQRARTEMDAAQQQADELEAAIRLVIAIEGEGAPITALFGAELEMAARNSRFFKTQLGETTQGLIYQMEATERAAEEAKRWQQVWSQVMANIVTDFARGISDVIFKAKSLAGALADIGKTTGRAFIQAFFAELFNPLTNLLASWGRELARTLQTSVIPKIAGAIGLDSLLPKAAGSASKVIDPSFANQVPGFGMGGKGGGLFGLSGAKLGAFFSNPITIGVGAAIASVIAATKLIGRGREQADKYGAQIERPFGQDLAALLAQFEAQRSAGTLTLATATAFRSDAATLISQLSAAQAEFAAQGSSQRKVVEQSMVGLTATYGSGFSRVFETINAAMVGLKATAVGAFPQTGLALSVTDSLKETAGIFREAVERFVDADGGSGGDEVHNYNTTNHNSINITVEGEGDFRKLIEIVVKAIEGNDEGAGARVTATVKNMWKGVVTA